MIDLKATLGHLAQALAAALTGNVIAAAEHAVEFALDLVPADDLRAYLTAAATRRANLAADLAEAAKFGKPDGG